jgi:hypothetical protein
VVSQTAGDRQSSPSSQREPARRWPADLLTAVVQTAFWHESSTPQSLSVRHVPPVGTTQTRDPGPACESQIVPVQQVVVVPEPHAVPRQAGMAVQTWVDVGHARLLQQSAPVVQDSLTLWHTGAGSHTFDDPLHTRPLQQASDAHDAPCCAQPCCWEHLPPVHTRPAQQASVDAHPAPSAPQVVHCPPTQAAPAAHAVPQAPQL